jgi:hypothetical protein
MTAASAGLPPPARSQGIPAPGAALVLLARRRLRERAGSRWSFGLGVLLAVGGSLSVLASVGAGAGGLSRTVAWVAVAAAWISGGLVALSAASGCHLTDRREGAEALVVLRGGSVRTLESARVLAAMAQVSLAIAVPVVVVGLVGSAAAGSVRGAALALGSIAASLVFAVATGVVVGGLAATCGRYGAGRGRWLLLVAVLMPWIVMDMAGAPVWSIPGGLDALLRMLGAA